MPSKYLSIDVDFWNHIKPVGNKNAEDLIEKYLDSIAEIALANGIPINAVMNHQQMLRFVNEIPAEQLVNIDTHSDLGDTLTSELNCGTWIAYVRWRKEALYHWIHAGNFSMGECNGDYPIFTRGHINKDYSDWGDLERTAMSYPPPAKEILEDCVGVGVVLSPAYSHFELQPVFYKWVKRWSIPYVKGRRDENYGRKRYIPRTSHTLKRELMLSS